MTIVSQNTSARNNNCNADGSAIFASDAGKYRKVVGRDVCNVFHDRTSTEFKRVASLPDEGSYLQSKFKFFFLSFAISTFVKKL